MLDISRNGDIGLVGTAAVKSWRVVWTRQIANDNVLNPIDNALIALSHPLIL
jgi:hypothetical protein